MEAKLEVAVVRDSKSRLGIANPFPEAPDVRYPLHHGDIIADIKPTYKSNFLGGELGN
jgi:hypothetical protein